MFHLAYAGLDSGINYTLRIYGHVVFGSLTYGTRLPAVPLPPALLLLCSALAVLGLFRHGRRRTVDDS